MSDDTPRMSDDEFSGLGALAWPAINREPSYNELAKGLRDCRSEASRARAAEARLARALLSDTMPASERAAVMREARALIGDEPCRP